MKQVSQNFRAILKRQCGDHYGTGDDIDSDLQIMKNMNQKMLHDPDATNTKVFENYSGNLDQEIRKTKTQRFEKCSDNPVIIYSRELADWQHKWQTKTNRKITADLKQEVFDKNQKLLMAKDIDEEDAAMLAMNHRVIKLVRNLMVDLTLLYRSSTIFLRSGRGLKNLSILS